MAAISKLTQIKIERPDTIEALHDMIDAVENDELESLVIIAMRKGNEGIQSHGFWNDRIMLIGSLEYAKMRAME